MNYAHIVIPDERHPTAAARSALSSLLGFEDHDDIQDWKRFFADDQRIGEFLTIYQERLSCDDEKFLLMDLILASTVDAEGGVPDAAQWQNIETLLGEQYELHAWTIWCWADIDEDTGIPSNDFRISRRMQTPLQRKFDERAASGLTGSTPVQPNFRNFWNTHFDGHKPVGHHLRQSLHLRWARFHSLPESKRYAETDDEWAVLFERHHRIADEVLGGGARCWLVLCGDPEDRDPEDQNHLERYDFEHWFSWWENDELGEAVEWPVYAAETIWRAGQFDDAIRKIAVWEEAFLLIVSQETQAIFAPYDGGIDLILPSGRQASILKAKFPNWRPGNAQGL